MVMRCNFISIIYMGPFINICQHSPNSAKTANCSTELNTVLKHPVFVEDYILHTGPRGSTLSEIWSPCSFKDV